jgi:ornithine cyclodeaminase/alanine dehydrogenase-like protein (mu-crystallin family)
VAAKYLASADASVATICGCGNQGRISVRSLSKVRKLKKIFAFDIDDDQTEKFKREFEQEVEVIPVQKPGLSSALQQSQIVVTCTPSKEPFIKATDIMRGTFIAAVGADNEDKQELFPELLTGNKLVTDLTEQCISIGELHHAIDDELMIRFEVHAELGQIIAGQKPGRVCDDEIIIFDSTGTALQDVAAAAIVFEKALMNGRGSKLNFSGDYPIDDRRIEKENEKYTRALRGWYPFR